MPLRKRHWAKASLIHDCRSCSRKATKLFLQILTNLTCVRTVYTPLALLAKERPLNRLGVNTYKPFANMVKWLWFINFTNPMRSTAWVVIKSDVEWLPLVWANTEIWTCSWNLALDWILTYVHIYEWFFNTSRKCGWISGNYDHAWRVGPIQWNCVIDWGNARWDWSSKSVYPALDITLEEQAANKW